MRGTSALLLKVSQAVDIVGADALIDRLDVMIENSPSNSNLKLIERFIISEVCGFYNTEENALSKPRVGGSELTARNMCFVLFSKHLTGYSHRSIGKIFGKTNGSVSNILKQFSAMETKVKHEREFIGNYEIFNKKVKDYKNQIKQQTKHTN
jgi:chromosomal replication initiation ATPase DnaA